MSKRKRQDSQKGNNKKQKTGSNLLKEAQQFELLSNTSEQMPNLQKSLNLYKQVYRGSESGALLNKIKEISKILNAHYKKEQQQHEELLIKQEAQYNLAEQRESIPALYRSKSYEEVIESSNFLLTKLSQKGFYEWLSMYKMLSHQGIAENLLAQEKSAENLLQALEMYYEANKISKTLEPSRLNNQEKISDAIKSTTQKIEKLVTISRNLERQERLAQIEKQEALNKIEEQERLAQIKKQEALDKIEEQERLAQIEKQEIVQFNNELSFLTLTYLSPEDVSEPTKFLTKTLDKKSIEWLLERTQGPNQSQVATYFSQVANYYKSISSVQEIHSNKIILKLSILASTLDPDNISYLEQLEQLYWFNENHQEDINVLHRIITLQPDNINYHCRLINAYNNLPFSSERIEAAFGLIHAMLNTKHYTTSSICLASNILLDAITTEKKLHLIDQLSDVLLTPHSFLPNYPNKIDAKEVHGFIHKASQAMINDSAQISTRQVLVHLTKLQRLANIYKSNTPVFSKAKKLFFSKYFLDINSNPTLEEAKALNKLFVPGEIIDLFRETHYNLKSALSKSTDINYLSALFHIAESDFFRKGFFLHGFDFIELTLPIHNNFPSTDSLELLSKIIGGPKDLYTHRYKIEALNILTKTYFEKLDYEKANIFYKLNTHTNMLSREINQTLKLFEKLQGHNLEVILNNKITLKAIKNVLEYKIANNITVESIDLSRVGPIKFSKILELLPKLQGLVHIGASQKLSKKNLLKYLEIAKYCDSIQSLKINTTHLPDAQKAVLELLHLKSGIINISGECNEAMLTLLSKHQKTSFKEHNNSIIKLLSALPRFGLSAEDQQKFVDQIVTNKFFLKLQSLAEFPAGPLSIISEYSHFSAENIKGYLVNQAERMEEELGIEAMGDQLELC